MAATKSPGRFGVQAGRGILSVLTAAWLWAASSHAFAASMSPKDLQVLGRTIAFLLPPPPSGTPIAIVYSAANPASRSDAEAIAALMGDGLKVGNAVLPPKVVESAALAAGGYRLIIAAQGASDPEIGAASRANHALCATANLESVQAGYCIMAIRSEPRVEIIISHTAAATAGVEFAAAFRMMIREI